MHRITLADKYGDEFSPELKNLIRKAFIRELELRLETDLTPKARADIVVEDLTIRGRVVFASKAVETFMDSSGHEDLWDDEKEYKSNSDGYDAIG